MIVYFDRVASRVTPPAWLEGAADLCARGAGNEKWYGIGDPWLCGGDPKAEQPDIGGGLTVAIVGTLDPLRLVRSQRWIQLAPARDLTGREWRVPRILSADGDRAFSTRYGADFLPLLTPEQTRILAIGQACRDALSSAHTGGGEVPMKEACAWAAELISAVNHIAPAVIGALGLLDDALVASCLYAASGFLAEREAANG
jgi:hypothetical protein